MLTRVKTDGLVEAFKWKQIDYYDRGNNYQLPPRISYSGMYARTLKKIT